RISRALSPGTQLFDFNRVEHLATLVYRFPLPPPGPVTAPGEKGEKKQETKPPIAYQKAALFAVRQNLCGVVLFEIKPEAQPGLTERQRRRQGATAGDDPQLYVVTANNPMLPCRMLLTPDGRLLELALKHGSREVVYTLDDPIMRRRAERAKHKKLDDGPQLIRPPWW
ncbi:MAG: hypothetical protein NTW87_06355, partial [Planctomycetota bacterium]|nr:hypothetical protein [Planctomycetota bacterium]